MKKRRNLILCVLVLVIGIAAMAAVWLATRPAAEEGSKTFTVEVVHKDGSEKVFTYSSDADYVGEVLLDEGLIAGTESEYGLYVLEVDGERAAFETDGAYWAFYVDGEYAAQGVDQTPLEDGATYGFVYTLG